jgi:hypothetical protein
MTNSVAVPVIEYRIETMCGRIISHSATDSQDLLDSFKRVWGLSIAIAEPFALWEARQSDGYEQLELNSEHEAA